MKNSFLFLVGLFVFSIAKGLSQNIQLMPYPEQISVVKGHFKIDQTFTVQVKGNPDKRIYRNATNFIRNISNKTGVFIDQGFVEPNIQIENPKLLIRINRPGLNELREDESYFLEVGQDQIVLNANTDLGAIHGLQTLFQLVAVQNGSYVFPCVKINDKPRFVWRGLMIDVSRHFMPVEVIKRNLDAMSFVKMNVFHWHLSDDQGFRVEVKSLPKLHEKGSDGDYYTQEQIKEIVAYAATRGIRVVPEFDVPPHATAILTAYPELGSKDTIYSLERNAGIFDPTLDPTNERVYQFLDQLFKEITPLFPDSYVHIGGDENAGVHWDENEKITQFKKENNLKSNHDLQTYFNLRLEKILSKYNKKLVGWEEIMTPKMSKSAVIHAWRGENEGLKPKQSLVDAVKNGHETILSNGYYIDLMLSVESHYLVDPMPDEQLSKEEEARVLGGEATMWSELVTPLTIDSRIWPRTAAIAERLWSPKEINDLDFMFERYEKISNDLEQIGIQHKRNKDVILRNISNFQDIRALDELSKISEPFKVYSRNVGGTEYKMFSPLTLFADACTADALLKRKFNKLVKEYISTENETSGKELISNFNNWGKLNDELKSIATQAPLIERIIPYTARIEGISKLMIDALENKKMSENQFDQLTVLLNQKEDPLQNLDVEFALKKSTLDLANYLRTIKP
ncbi:beta-N-acetylhexosaminidase [Namhaeicola litoreus]|uniref:Beta-N-acetylhexosaminidase n=1 Tax=Namhaeicola litoreus TaxID=1052145 RepID=A0ABW3Y1Z5_9FLAO